MRDFDVLDAILPTLMSDDRLLREISTEVFKDYSGHSLPFDFNESADVRAIQYPAIVEWWARHKLDTDED